MANQKTHTLTKRRFSRRQVLLIAAVFAVIGVLLLLRARADTSLTGVLEAEAGVLTNTLIADDADASGQKYVSLNADATIPPPPPPPTGDSCGGVPMIAAASQMDCIFNDEFNATTLDESKWGNIDIWQWTSYTGSGYVAWDLARNVTFTDGLLRLKAVREEHQGAPWTAAEIVTQNRSQDPAIDGSDPKFKFKYGYVESKMKVPAGRGFVTAFWMRNVHDQPFAEYELVEFVGNDNEGFRFNHPNHFSKVPGKPNEAGQAAGGTEAWDYGTDLTADFHTYGLLWEPDAVTWYFNGREIKKVTDPASVFDSEMTLWYSFYLFNTEGCACGYNAGPDATTPSPGYFDIDYVRVWQ